ncbi:phosphocholine-specific phospholipase C [Asticcacaulis excentricus]|uniref:phospholipase C n=1 Tax=Asticcacaulis excentricus TaxID=78587 RepID=A0A3G9GCX6_9CAUL|nr:phospholipase C, phosphocholine-specific [Asticcacaulis excentricus]BBF82579.1 phospholipase C [Asticcacaulis excentricus]
MATDRRSFLRLMGAGVATSALYPEIAAALDIPAKRVSGTLQDVKHIVILMQENRSFDHYFGTLKGVRGFGDRHPVPMPAGPVWQQSDGQNLIAPFHLDTKTTNAIAVPGTPHSFADSQAAWNQGRFGYWPKFKNPYSMGYYKRSDIPFQFALAEAFTICDAYHCSITTGTDPNRIVFWSGSNHDPQLRAKGINATEANSEPNNLRCWIKGALPEPGYTYQGTAFDWPTIPDVLEQAGVSWRIYQDPNDNWTGAMHGGLAFRSFRECKPGDPLYEKGMAHWSLEQFAEDARQGTLPAVSWILPPKDWSEHPSASTPLQGAEFTAGILKALTANPETWSQSVFFQTFDENDGLFDHAPPPAPPSYRADGTLAGKSTLPLEGFYFSDPDGKYRDPRDTVSGSLRPWGLGPRVPMYVVSPWSKGGFVASEVFDHTSVGQFIEKRFGVVVPAISPWHRAVCGDLTSCFDFDTPNDPTFPPLPDSSNSEREVLRQIHRKAITPPSVPQPLQQESGARPSRPLPYRPEVTARVGGTDLTLDLRNSGTRGLVLHVYDRLNLDLIPRRYTIEAGKHLSDVWSVKDKAYDLWVSGPNGFLRIFAGQSDFAAETALETRRNTLVLTLKNHAKTLQKLTMDQSVYGGPVQTVSLDAGKTQSVTLDTGASGGWYDVTVSAEGFLRRYAGRLESGHASISDPAV